MEWYVTTGILQNSGKTQLVQSFIAWIQVVVELVQVRKVNFVGIQSSSQKNHKNLYCSKSVFFFQITDNLISVFHILGSHHDLKSLLKFIQY